MSLRLLPGVLLALMVLQACDGTPFGQRLADSFDGPSAQRSPEGAGPSVQAKAEPETQAPAAADSAADAKEDRAEAEAAESDTPKTDTVKSEAIKTEASPEPSGPDRAGARADLPRTASGRTRPYRITIRLSSADPAAPAEGVTEALRRAGIGFEVETIEKISSAQQAGPMDARPTPSP